jgi:hypothetical protein
MQFPNSPFVRSGARAALLIAIAFGAGGCDLTDPAVCVWLHGLFGVECPSGTTEAESSSAQGTATASAGDVLLVGGISTGAKTTQTAELFKAATKTFAATGAPFYDRAALTAIAFPSGPLQHQVLVAAGGSGDMRLVGVANFLTFTLASLSTSETYNPSTGHFTLSGNLATGRAAQSVTLLKSGKVLFAGGFSGFTPTATAELFDPATKSFTTIAPLHVARAMHTATLLADGTVLIAGGVTTKTGTVTTVAEIYDPVKNSFTLVASHAPARMAGHTATLIAGCGCAADGKVLLTGGFGGAGVGTQAAAEKSQATALIYDPAHKTFSAAPAMHDQRVFHTATLLPGGNVLLAGGMSGSASVNNGNVFGNTAKDNVAHRTAEIYNARVNIMTCIGGQLGSKCRTSLHASHVGHSATPFGSGPLKGQVLIAGGNATKAAELYVPATKSFGAVAAKMIRPRAFHTGVLLP